VLCSKKMPRGPLFMGNELCRRAILFFRKQFANIAVIRNALVHRGISDCDNVAAFVPGYVTQR